MTGSLIGVVVIFILIGVGIYAFVSVYSSKDDFEEMHRLQRELWRLEEEMFELEKEIAERNSRKK